MAIKIGVIGVGNCGSQIAMLAKKSGFPAIAMNSSERDIEAINGSIDAIVFGSRAGAGKNRGLANDYMRKNMDKIIGEPALKNLADDNDLLVVIASTGGGTGSGTAPMLAAALDGFYNSKVEREEEKKMFISIGILPSMGESIGALRNTGEYLEQLTRLDPNRRYMLFDNDRVKGSIAQINDTINRDVVQALKVIRGDYSLSTQYGMIDENDTRKLIMAPGMIFIDKIENLYEEILPVGGSVEDVLLSHIHQENHMVKPDRNKVVKYLGFISNLDVSMHGYFNDHLPKVREAFGEPDEDFAHFAVNEDGHESNMLAVIMTGMTHPMNKINEINKRIDVLEKEIAAKNEARKRVTGLEELNSRMSNLDGNRVVTSKREDFDLDALMSQYK